MCIRDRISTKWGLNKLSQKSNAIEEYYNEFGENSYIAKDNQDYLYVFNRPNTLSLYSNLDNKFINFPIYKEKELDNVSSFIVDSQDTIWINHKGIMERYTISGKKTNNPQIVRHPDFTHPHLCLLYTSPAFQEARSRIILIKSAAKL